MLRLLETSGFFDDFPDESNTSSKLPPDPDLLVANVASTTISDTNSERESRHPALTCDKTTSHNKGESCIDSETTQESSPAECSNSNPSQSKSADSSHVELKTENSVKPAEQKSDKFNCDKETETSANQSNSHSPPTGYLPKTTEDRIRSIRAKLGYDVTASDIQEVTSLTKAEVMQYVGQLLMRHMCQLVCNAHAIGATEARAVGGI